MNYKDYILSKGGQELGILWDDIENHLLTPAQFKEFEKWMGGQTCGSFYEYGYVYTGDYVRFIKGLPIID